MAIYSGCTHEAWWFSLIFHRYVSSPEGIVPKYPEKCAPDFSWTSSSSASRAPPMPSGRWGWLIPCGTTSTSRHCDSVEMKKQNRWSERLMMRFRSIWYIYIYIDQIMMIINDNTILSWYIWDSNDDDNEYKKHNNNRNIQIWWISDDIYIYIYICCIIYIYNNIIGFLQIETKVSHLACVAAASFGGHLSAWLWAWMSCFELHICPGISWSRRFWSCLFVEAFWIMDQDQKRNDGQVNMFTWIIRCCYALLWCMLSILKGVFRVLTRPTSISVVLSINPSDCQILGHVEATVQPFANSGSLGCSMNYQMESCWLKLYFSRWVQSTNQLFVHNR